MTATTGGITITQFQLIVTLLGIAFTAFSAWLYRHERWFRDIAFPVIQALTGRSPHGNTVDSTDQGHFQETENRLQRIEEDIDGIKQDVQELQRRQDRHNQKTESYLRRVVAKVEDVDLGDVDKPLFRKDDETRRDGGGSSSDN